MLPPTPVESAAVGETDGKELKVGSEDDSPKLVDILAVLLPAAVEEAALLIDTTLDDPEGSVLKFGTEDEPPEPVDTVELWLAVMLAATVDPDGTERVELKLWLAEKLGATVDPEETEGFELTLPTVDDPPKPVEAATFELWLTELLSETVELKAPIVDDPPIPVEAAALWLPDALGEAVDEAAFCIELPGPELDAGLELKLGIDVEAGLKPVDDAAAEAFVDWTYEVLNALAAVRNEDDGWVLDCCALEL